jgi:DNA-binding NtrC family response regulator
VRSATLSGRILLVDDDQEILTSIGEALAAWGAVVKTAPSAEAALQSVRAFRPDVVLTDVRMEGMGGLELLRTLRERGESSSVVLMTAYDDMPTIVAAMKGGAVEFLVKPLELDVLAPMMQRLLEDRATMAKIARKSAGEPIAGQLVGRTPAMIEIYKRIGQAAATRATVLVRGESGTGKELIARAVHANSSAADEPFVAVNCTALPSTLLESELFGHVKGAFTGAVSSRRGCFAAAGRGTVFLDEIGDTTLEFQSKLLRVLQTKEYQPVGSEQIQQTQARVVAATHRDLERLMTEGTFREDLYYRLRVLEITVSPLRERIDDVPLLVAHVLAAVGRALEVQAPHLSADALTVLMAHPWPGNVRELENCLTRAAVLASGRVIRPEHLTLRETEAANEDALAPLQDVEREHIERVLRATGGHKTRAAEILQLSRPRLNRLLRRYGLE